MTREQERDELHRAIWHVANDLRGSVDGLDFKSYVLGILFYRFISENLTSHINKAEWETGNTDFDVQVLIPTCTFIEKVLLDEEFSKPVDKIRTDRLTRHFYDLDKIRKAGYGEAAIADDELFNTIVQHRKTVTPLRGMGYSSHMRGKLFIMPRCAIIEKNGKLITRRCRKI